MDSTQTNTILDIALNYARSWGWAVFPVHGIENNACTCGRIDCRNAGKHPMTANGVLDATRDETKIREWFGDLGTPWANIGIATGKLSGLVVVDVDEAKGGKVIDLFFGDISEISFDTPVIQTGGGFHYYYAYPKTGEIKNSTSKLGNFIDVRGEGGYVVAPPSKHISGRNYEFLNPECEKLLDFPEAWLNKLNPAPNGNEKGNGAAATGYQSDNANPFIIPPPYEGFVIPEVIGDGTRNDTLTKIAGALRHTGLSEEAIFNALVVENSRLCKPPLDILEVKQIARSIARKNTPNEYSQVSDNALKSFDDISFARLFASEHRDRLCYNPEAKKWLIWDGTRWQTDRKDKALEIGSQFAQKLYSRIFDLTTNKAEVSDAQKQIKRSNTLVGLNAFLNIAKAYLSLTNENFDQNNYLLNCKNGTFDLKAGKLLPHDPKRFITKLVPFDYVAGAKSAEFEKFIATIQPDEAIRRFLQISIGYSLLGIARERSFWILYGHGNNGKSVFIDLFSEILSDYASSTTSSSVMSQKGDRIPNDIARLVGKRFIVIPETEENERLNAALIKQLSGGDKMTARFLFAEYFDFYFSGKLWIATNHKPRITDHSKGFWDRLKIIPFTVDIPKEKVIKKDTLLNLLLTDAPAILNWAIEGAREYLLTDGLTVPDAIQKEIADYKYEQDSMAQFLDEKCEIDEFFYVDNTAIYQKYVDFCKDTGEYQRNHRVFSQNLRERGFIQKRGTVRYWQGVKLK